MTIPTTKDLVDRLVVAVESRTETDIMLHPNIYFLGEDIVAKRSYIDTDREFKMGKFLFERSISVPEMYDVADVTNIKILAGRYVFMERIKNCSYIEELTDPKERLEACQRFREEERKVRELGVVPDDCNRNGNSLFDRKNGKLYLIDFELWYFMDKERDRQFEKALELAGR